MDVLEKLKRRIVEVHDDGTVSTMPILSGPFASLFDEAIAEITRLRGITGRMLLPPVDITGGAAG